MKYYVPDYRLNIIAEEDFSDAIVNIEEELEKIKVQGKFKAFDGIDIYYEYFLAENSKGTVVVVHGLSEFTKKFYEFAYYMLNQGYNVFMYDQRCHGLSDRLTNNIELMHVDKFNDYVEDLTYFIDKIVLKTEDKPLYIYSHSMGGAISTLYIAKYPEKIKKALLSVPMFQPIVKQVSVPLARESIRLGRWVFGRKRKFFLSSDFDPNVQYSLKQGSSRARFEYNMKLRRENREYQMAPMSFGWTFNSLIVCKKIFKRKTINSIKTPILLITADNDTVVNNKMHYTFNEKCNCCELVNIEDGTHALLASDSNTLTRIMNLTLSFFAD